MQSFTLLYPAFAMALLSFTVSVRLIQLRFKAVKEGGTSLSYFKFNQGEIPAYAKQAEQHYINLFEMPVLFYVLLLIAFVTQTTHIGLILLAWLYVLARAAHTYVHLSSNKVLLRMRTFLVSFVILIMMWLWVLLALCLR